MKIQFNLRTDKVSSVTGLAPISVVVHNDGERIRKVLPQIKVLKKDWNDKSQSVNPSKKDEPYNFSREYNIQLANVKTRLTDLWSRSFLENRLPDKKQIVMAIDDDPFHKSSNESIGFIEVMDLFISQNKSHKAERTIKGYITTRNLLVEFSEFSRQRYSLNDLDLRFFDEFRNFCLEQKKYMNNTFAKCIAHVKTFMAWAEDRGYHNNNSYQKFKANEEDIEVIYLTMDELLNLYNYEFKNHRLEKVRDIYCFSCFTGLRYSDLANLKPSNIFEDRIKINVTKTRDKDQIVPLSKYSQEILNRYRDTPHYPLPMISSQKLNEYIKEVCKEVGIDSPVTTTRYSGRTKIEKTVPKYELLTLHTGRKTFVTNSLVLGMNQVVVKGITGHKSDSSFRKYVMVADDVKSNELTKYWDNL